MSTSDTEKPASGQLLQAENAILAQRVDPKKYLALIEACNQRDVAELIKHANSEGGLLSDDIRRSAWPIILGLERTESPTNTSWQTLPAHPDEEQVQRDVDRAFVYYPTESHEAVTSRKGELYDTIVHVLRRHRMLNYFQGYHDIVQVLLLVLGPQLAVSAVSHISLLKIRDYMLPTMAPAIQHLNLIPAILYASDRPLAVHLQTTQPFFALSATLTLYAHDIQEYSDIARLYDFVLAHEPVMTVYLFSAIVIFRRKELLEIPLDEPEMLHFTLSKLPQPLNLEALIQGALGLFEKHPPETLKSKTWRQISSLSVLKTSRSVPPSQTLAAAEGLWFRQANELRRQELLKKGAIYVRKNQRPIVAVAATVIVGIYSIWLRKSGNDRLLLNMALRSAEFLRSWLRQS